MYRVKDYRFESEKDAKEAQSELRAVEYLRTKVNMDQPEAALEIYKQLLSEEIFHTIVGYDFLKGLKNYLLTSPAVDNAAIPEIPDALAQKALMSQEQAAVALSQPPSPQPAAEPVAEPQASVEMIPQMTAEPEATRSPVAEPIPLSGLTPVPKLNEEARKEEAAIQEQRKQEKESKRKRKEPKPKKTERKKREPKAVSGRYRTLAFTFGATTAILLVAVIAMFVITMTSSNPTILDYETKLLNKYARWEDELTQREAEVKRREADVEYREEAIRSQTFAPIPESTPQQPTEETAGDEAEAENNSAEDEASAGTPTDGQESDNGE